MTKVYDALRQAEAERQRQSDARVGTGLLFGGSAPQAHAPEDAGGELERLRGIVVGSMARDFAHALTRIEQRFEVEWTGLRAEICKLEQRIEGRLCESDARSTQGQAALREQLEAESHRLGDRIKQRSAEVVRLASDGFRELRHVKLDDGVFDAFLHALASHLAREGGR